MAIVKMKKLLVIAMRSQKDALMRDLDLLGCVEVAEPDDLFGEEELAGIAAREDGGAEARRAQSAALRRALDVLNRYAPEKSPMFAARREISADDFFGGKDEERLFALAADIDEADSRLHRLDAEETRLGGYIESLAPWENHKLPLDYEGTKTTGLLLGAIPASSDIDALDAAMADAAPLCEMFRVSSGREQHCLCAVFARESRQEVADVLRAYGFTAASHKGSGVTASEAIAKAREELKDLKSEREELRAKISGASGDRQKLLYMLDLTQARLTEAEAAGQLFATERTATLAGWMPASSESTLRDVLSRYVCASELRDPTEDELADVPVKLKNNAITSPLMMVTEMYSLPSYDGIDPNPLMAPFFIPFYGFMMADMGYGILMVVAALLIRRKKPRGGMKNFINLLLMCGITTICGGFLTAGFFGDAPTQIAALFGKTFALPWTPLLDPLNEPIQVLIFAFALGFVQIIAGMAINLYMAVRDGHALDGILDNVPWWITFAGVAVLVLGKMGKLGESFAGTLAFVPMIVGCVLVAATQGRSKPTIGGKIVSGLGSLYNITAYFSDVLSYARVMALMLAGGVIANVFNMIGAMTGPIFFWPIFLIGHALNIALNLLGNYVHDLRLQCLEYFGKFYKDGGRAFRPLEVKSKYYNVVKQSTGAAPDEI